MNHSHRTIWNSNPIWPLPVTRSRTKVTVVRTVTISSNITGFLISVRGSSLTKAEPIAGHTILGSSKVEAGVPLRVSLRILDSSMAVTPRSVR